MRKLMMALGLLYTLVMGQLGWESWQVYQLSLDAQPISGKVTECEQDPLVHDSVFARYEFEVDGRRYSNSFETTPVPVGSQIDLFYSPSNPDRNSAHRPDFRLRRAWEDAFSFTAGFAFWAVLLQGIAWLRRRSAAGDALRADLGLSRDS